ncbi:hypothetical protein EVG20_g8441 [Dentipellis fragilis]|uniref:C2H2-type domain-containing protein n=1 Tax=Dentipellis fragilis TaxID=205917 RepID=A0A4Y9Y8E1_9AGAM|nr:hypothetical protein EVG20_g8441 [Dentipellis fragilis]
MSYIIWRVVSSAPKRLSCPSGSSSPRSRSDSVTRPGKLQSTTAVTGACSVGVSGGTLLPGPEVSAGDRTVVVLPSFRDLLHQIGETPEFAEDPTEVTIHGSGAIKVCPFVDSPETGSVSEQRPLLTGDARHMQDDCGDDEEETYTDAQGKIFKRCPTCDQQVRIYNLRRHQRTHLPRGFTCTTCSRTYRREDRLLHHRKTKHQSMVSYNQDS